MTSTPVMEYTSATPRPQVLQWAHDASLAKHPDHTQSLKNIRRYFWWPSIRDDITEYVAACVMFASQKSDQQPQGLLLRPPFPHRPWTHINVDIILGLPPSERDMFIFSDCTTNIPTYADGLFDRK